METEPRLRALPRARGGHSEAQGSRSHLKMKLNEKGKVLAIVGGVYCFLWILTATWGISDVDRAFDREFSVGTAGFADNPMTVSIQRIDKLPNIRNPMDPVNQLPETGFFRFRTRGIAVAPFVVVDQAATVFASLGGFGGKRVNVWFFGFTKWWIVSGYWAV